jgi:DNA-binding CsgD family transcriptional regulator
MDTNMPVNKTVDKSEELAFFQNIFDLLPAVVYINELQKPGDPLSCRNIWTNKTGLDAVGYSQEDITQMGHRYFQEIIHPDDLEILSIPNERQSGDTSISVTTCLQRVRYKDQSEYHWSYGHGVTISTFDDGSSRQLLVVAMDITETMHTDNQLVAALKEIKQLKSCLRLITFTKREKEILTLIVKGKTDKFISEKLFISIKTAKKHRTNIIHKAGVKNTAELVALLTECGLN